MKRHHKQLSIDNATTTRLLAPKSAPSRRRRFLFAIITILLSITVAFSFCEIVLRVMEYRDNSRNVTSGSGGKWVPDSRWGWKPSQGGFHVTTGEYDAVGSVNELWMNDETYNAADDEKRVRVLALGDSHTYAVGVSNRETWPKVLQKKLNAAAGSDRYRVYNAGAIGYSMHQYVLRLLDQGPQLQPQYVVLGLSYATDLYDLLPPDRGGWVYGGNAARDYFDFEKNELTLRHWQPKGSAPETARTAQVIRDVLDNFATFRYLRRSSLALFVGSHVKIGGESLWPNMDVVLEKNVQPEHEYQWRLFVALLELAKHECDRQHARLIVVGIPYLPQVYDEIWNSTFGQNQAYSRTAATERVQSECQKLGITYLDTADAMRSKSKALGHWLHYRKDAHPTTEGHEVIADTIYRADVIR
jgi:lysophospholipase L1-like esterase